MRLSDFDYELPRELIAQTPLAERDRSRLLVLDRAGGVSHHRFFELADLLPANAVLVFNESRVLPARLRFTWGSGQAEILLLRARTDGAWECLVRPGPKFKTGARGILGNLGFEVTGEGAGGTRFLKFEGDVLAYAREHGLAPTPPYIKEVLKDPERYQTVYGKSEGSAAAPTAGLHFTEQMMDALHRKGIGMEFVTLHVGPGTFLPVKTEQIKAHRLHSEWFELKSDVAGRLNEARRFGRPIIAVGTTSVRVLESCADEAGVLHPKSGETELFITPGYRFKFVHSMITNFHVPKSSLLMLVSALAGRENILNAYGIAKKEGYRFFSFGDAMWIRG